MKAQPWALSHAALFPSEVAINAVLLSVIFPATEAFTAARLAMATHGPEQGEWVRRKRVMWAALRCVPA